MAGQRIVPLAVLCLLLASARFAVAAPRVAVVECPTAEAWLRAANVDCQSITAADLAAPIPAEVQLLVLPLDRVRSEGSLRTISSFASRGGKVVAVYWGTLARPDRQSEYPVYQASAMLGYRVVGWSLAGPVRVKTEPNIADGAVDALPFDQLSLVRVQPDASAQVLARLVPVSGGEPMVLALRNGNIFAVTANLFHRSTEAAGVRRLFFWMLDQAAPGLAMALARERAGAAMAAVIRARERLNAAGLPNSEQIRRLLDEAGQSADRAKSLAARQQFEEAGAAVNSARELTERALRLLEQQ